MGEVGLLLGFSGQKFGSGQWAVGAHQGMVWASNTDTRETMNLI